MRLKNKKFRRSVFKNIRKLKRKYKTFNFRRIFIFNANKVFIPMINLLFRYKSYLFNTNKYNNFIINKFYDKKNFSNIVSYVNNTLKTRKIKKFYQIFKKIIRLHK
jgi:hypothetical protein